MAAIWDILIKEDGNGGDFQMRGNDLAVCKSIEGAAYMSMFGGCVEADTKLPRVVGEQDFSYWGNIFIQQPVARFNSLTERTLNNTPLTSAGRPIIENAIRKDFSFIPGATVAVSIVSTDRINVAVTVILPSGLPKVETFSLSRNPITGDFDLGDFNFLDFF